MNEQMRCTECGGDMVQGMTSIPRFTGGRLVLFENVPAFVCGQCGNTVVSSATAHQIDRILDEHPAPARVIETPVHDLASVELETRSA